LLALLLLLLLSLLLLLLLSLLLPLLLPLLRFASGSEGSLKTQPLQVWSWWPRPPWNCSPHTLQRTTLWRWVDGAGGGDADVPRRRHKVSASDAETVMSFRTRLSRFCLLFTKPGRWRRMTARS